MKTYSFLIVLVFCLLLFPGCVDKTSPPSAANGIIDLSQWDFEKNGIVRLNGQWEFYWKRLLTPEDFNLPDQPAMTGFFTSPGPWDGYEVSGKPLGPHGYATFRLKVKLPTDLKEITLDLWNHSGAYRIWLDDRPMLKNPQVGINRASTRPTRRTDEKTFSLSSDTVVITVQKANFYGNSGAFGNLLAGPAGQIRRGRSMMSIMELFCLGSLLVMSIYHFSIFLFRQKDRSALYFSLVCLLWAAYTPYAGYHGFTLWDVIPLPPLRFAYAAGLVPVYLGVPITIMFLHSLYPRQGSKKLVYFFMLLGILFSTAAIFLPDTLSGRTLLPYEFISLFAGLFALVIVVRAVLKKEPGAQIIMWGIILQIAFAINDMLIDRSIIATIPLLPVGTVILLLSHSLVLAKRFSMAHILAENYAEELEEKNITLARMDMLKNEFLANTSHELRTPIHGIIGMAEVIRSESAQELSQHVREDLDIIISSARSLSLLINDILDFSRLSHSEILLQKTVVDMRILTDTVIKSARTLVKERPVSLINDIDKNIPPVSGDENRLRQILYNLVGNAVKFTEKGEVRISARLEENMVKCTVSDTGIGISRDSLDRIFEPFEQADGSITRQFGGTGLGLAITRRLVELHGGIIRVESEPCRGASFSFTMPIAASRKAEHFKEENTVLKTPLLTGPALETVPEKNTDPGEMPSLKDPHQNSDDVIDRATILAIDDDPVNLRAISRHLTGNGFTVITADSARDGLRIIEEGPLPDLLLLDIMMPRMSGHDVLQTLRKSHTLHELPVIVLTAKNPVTDLVLEFKSGANDYLIKPFLLDELMARIIFQLEIKKAYRTLEENADLKLSLADQRRKKIEARLQARQTALDMLRFQLNPHFLFNALVSIRGSILQHPETARSMITSLSEFCRLSLAYGMEPLVILDQEISLVKRYFEIEKARQGDRMQVEMEFDADTLKYQVPAFLLQPLAENAVKYGRITSPEPLKIRLASCFREGRLVITVANTGTWVIPGTKNPEQGAGIGLDNIRKRLEQMYPEQFIFSRTEDNGWVVMKIELPEPDK